MARIDVTQATVLERILERLRDQLDLNTQQCYETLDAYTPPRLPKGGEYAIAVSPTESAFEEGEQADGNFTEHWGVAVTIYTLAHALDQTDHAAQVLRDAGRGLLVLKAKVLAALVGHDLTDADGNTFLRQLLYARSCGRPDVQPGDKRNRFCVMLTLEFGVDYDWDLP